MIEFVIHGLENPLKLVFQTIPTILGFLVYTAPVPIPNAGWTERNATFVAPVTGSYITVRCGGPFSGSLWTQVDNFQMDSCNPPIVDLGVDTTLCLNNTLTLDVTTLNATYLWQDNSTDPTFTIDQPGTYWVDVSVDNCTGTDTIHVDYFSLPNNFLGNDTSICDGEILNLDASIPGAMYEWQDNSQNSNFIVTEAGNYWVEVNINNCIEQDSINVALDALPIVDIGNDTTLCLGDELTINAELAGVSYLWSTGSIDSLITVSTTDQYSVTLTDLVSGCQNNFSINVDFINAPVTDLGPDQNLCEGEIVILDAFFPGANYLWQDNSLESSYTVSSSGLYSVDVSFGSCNSSDSVQILLSALPEVDLGPDTSICEETVLLLDVSLPNTSFIWQDASQSAQYEVEESGLYFVVATDNQSGCSNTDSINIATVPIPTLDFGNDTLVCRNDGFLLRPTIAFADSTIWQNGTNVEEFLAVSPATYFATSYNACGEVFDDIEIQFEDCSCNIFIPNAISPNADGINDAFKATVDNCEFLNYEFSLLNRWGQVVFESDDPETPWRANNDRNSEYYSQSDVYLWVLKYELISEDGITSNIMRGHLTLIR